MSIAFSAVSVSIAIWFQMQYHHQASMWFAIAIGGLGSFLLEILIYRYGTFIKPLVSETMFNSIISFSDMWALVGGMLLTTALPRMALLRTGAKKGLLWNLFLFSFPIITFIFGTLFLIGIKRDTFVVILQMIIFTTSMISIIIILFNSLGDQKKKNRLFFRRIGILSIILLPFIILDALGLHLPAFLNDMPIAFYVCGICLISIFEVQNLFGQPTFMENNKISNFFYELHKISPREKDVIELVLLGDGNSIIGEKLFISEKTVENHLTSILRKTEVKNRIELFRLIHSSRD